MAGEANTASGPATAPQNLQIKARARKASRKRSNGPPQLQFVIATDPSQFKDASVKRSVRSQAMVQYRYKADKLRLKEKEAERTAKENPAAPQEPQLPPAQSSSNHGGIVGPEPDEYQYGSQWTPWWSGPNEADYTAELVEPQWSSVSSSQSVLALPMSRYFLALAAVPPTDAAGRVTDYEETDAHGDNMFSILTEQLSRMAITNIGGDIDPFCVLSFNSPELRPLSMNLVRECLRAFVSPATMAKWAPAMMAHPHILLSSTTLASSWWDMHEGWCGDTKRTTLVKGEIISWINQRLRNTTQQFEDSTLMIILHLLVGEMWSCNERTLRIHESGIARLISHRGGMDCLGGGGAMAEVAASCCLHTDILCEAPPLPLFRDWQPKELAPISDATAIPESPIFCPRAEFFTIARDPRCSQITFDLLCDMRELTDLFIARHDSLPTVYEVDTTNSSATSASSPHQHHDSTYDIKIAEIRMRLASLPSAYMPGLPITNDWVYEAVRIASIIYATAIMHRIPFSIAAQPTRAIVPAHPLPMHPGSSYSTHAYPPPPGRPLNETLYEALRRSNTENVWGDMSGVLYWVSLVGAAASRTKVSVKMEHAPVRYAGEAYESWVRRSFIMYATRTMIILIFQHPGPVVSAQRRMVRLQGLVGRGVEVEPGF